jgi:hypothetical protein
VRQLKARAHDGDLDARTRLRELLKDEPLIRLPALSDILSDRLDPPDDSGDGGMREPRRPLPKGPSGSTAR